jgi:hypothetical protein
LRGVDLNHRPLGYEIGITTTYKTRVALEKRCKQLWGSINGQPSHEDQFLLLAGILSGTAENVGTCSTVRNARRFGNRRIQNNLEGTAREAQIAS